MSRVLGLHISDTEFAQWEAYAASQGLALTKWVRRAVTDAMFSEGHKKPARVVVPKSAQLDFADELLGESITPFTSGLAKKGI